MLLPFLKQHVKSLLLVCLLLVYCNSTFAHAINYALEKAPPTEVFWFYAKLGFVHILPQGLDHILFVISLCLLSNKIKIILWQATAFTVAHSITLLLSLKNLIVAPSAIVEPIIALSIVFVAVENLFVNELKSWRIIILFLFGLIHGLGFASSINEIGLPRNQFVTSVLSFNIGVELGQIAIIAAFFLFVAYPFKNRIDYKKFVVKPLSIFIGVVALYWFVERVFM